MAVDIVRGMQSRQEAPFMHDSLVRLGWHDTLAGSFHAHRLLGRLPARVIAVHKETAIVRGEGGVARAIVSGRFRFEATSTADYPAVGDWVALEGAAELAGEHGPTATAAAHGAAVIAAILPRGSAFRRSAADASRRGSGRTADEQVLAANVDVAFLVAGLDRDFNLRRIERYLAVAWSSNVTPVVVLNKADLADDLEGRLLAVEAIAPGVPIVVVSALNGDGLSEVEAHLRPGRTAVVLGSSGVGKSTLLNALLGEARQATAAVRADDSRGRHTTTHRELFELPGGGLLIDTPGIRSLEVAGADEGIAAAFDDVAAIAERCRFADCRHDGEPGCAVQLALDEGRLSPQRFESHRKLEREAAHAVRKADPAARLEEKKRWKAIHKAVGKHMDRKYGEEWR
jgi:ribosome biogenesis GTPase / thiamine phosphate phosphatase